MIDKRLVEAVVRAVLAQLEHDEPLRLPRDARRRCCPDRFGRMVGAGAERFGLPRGRRLPRRGRPPHRPHPAQARRHAGADREALRGGAPVRASPPCA